MRKLKLNLDALNVESFGTGRPADEVGTVRANQEQNVEYPDSGVTACTCASGDFTMGCNMESFTRCDWTWKC
jgi:hypothetical protein